MVASTTMHTAIISLKAHFVYVVFVLSISVQYVGCNLAVNIYVVFSGPISVISLGTPGTKRLQVEHHHTNLPAGNCTFFAQWPAR